MPALRARCDSDHLKPRSGEGGIVFSDAAVASAILDGLLHHSHLVTIRGDSYRFRETPNNNCIKMKMGQFFMSPPGQIRVPLDTRDRAGLG
ncbi:ATP-binding protein [Pseudooceanicola sp. HF7]|uniref:ATP-binding protein n=1 Tax=Pseudooceanicola sp. HF7 TaxID=2721560 RepID=UPI0034C6DDA1